ncbi:MAG: alanine racemase, partial [Lachnospiraceae bacterium]|nr:alanine racemase [Lachnospiraceae bacterium]
MTEEAYWEKYHRAFVKVDLDALCENITNIRRLVCGQTGLMAVVKADGYGHGAVPVARAFDALTENGRPVVDAYGVAMVEEGVELRRAGVTKPVLVLGHSVPEQAGEAVRSGLTLTVFEPELAQALSAEAVRQGRTARIHIKLDTGMSRIGYAGTERDAAEVVRIGKLPGIELEGLFSHFAKADEADKTSANRQFEKFSGFVQMLAKAGVKPRIKHIANSAAIIDMPETALDMVRAGIAVYGLYPSEEVDKSRLLLRPALEFKSCVSYVKEIPEGTSVGYGGIFTAERPMRLATIPVGYADGYPRALSNCGRVLIGGKSARIVGRICMYQFMVD